VFFAQFFKQFVKKGQKTGTIGRPAIARGGAVQPLQSADPPFATTSKQFTGWICKAPLVERLIYPLKPRSKPSLSLWKRWHDCRERFSRVVPNTRRKEIALNLRIFARKAIFERRPHLAD
jgi:hypothetical protein